MWCEMILWASRRRRNIWRSQSVAADVYIQQDFTKAKQGSTKLIENEPESQSWLEGRARRRRERIKSERAFLRAKQQRRETTKIQNRGSNPLGFFSTSMSPSRATLDQKHGPSSLPHAFCFFLLFCLHYSLSLLRKKYRLNSLCINTIELCDSLNGKEFRARF